MEMILFIGLLSIVTLVLRIKMFNKYKNQKMQLVLFSFVIDIVTMLVMFHEVNEIFYIPSGPYVDLFVMVTAIAVLTVYSSIISPIILFFITKTDDIDAVIMKYTIITIPSLFFLLSVVLNVVY